MAQTYMQDWPLVMPYILDHAARWHGEQSIVCRSTEGPVTICTYSDVHRRAKLVALALKELGIRCGIVLHHSYATGSTHCNWLHQHVETVLLNGTEQCHAV
jgi:hypothetical protein